VPGLPAPPTLPIVSQPAEQPTPEPASEPARLRACIVDDHVLVRDWLSHKLEAAGFDVCESCGTLAEGVSAILAHRPDLAVVDNRLPDGRGIDLCREVSAQAPDVALILHTGMISPTEESEAYEAGVDRIAMKSIQGDDLISAIAEFAARHGA
jgi:DNA-binding NarL/FixJ family response regulator